MEAQPVKCDQCTTPIFDWIEPCEKYPMGAIRVIAKHHGKRDESIKDLRELQGSKNTAFTND